ncbi:zonular occludens toxin domain-containing protein [Acidithiobacillus albertensis]|uniref:zonular occludens toxin domain-containing protein n=1 Tax=Acidithiobacillus albertensis TaxID=119978 RepID=UPI00094B2818|nr:zonular occludens toxin domain-containing protein [Acidithiobacillus albertensis]
MLGLYTGAPGAGKTLKMLNDHLAHSDGSRLIYVYGVEGLVPSDKWLPLDDPKDWAKCPYGSLILVDEAQAVFRPRRPGDPIPDYVSAAETHRHLGLDLFMTTQYPMLIDAHLRRLVSDHQHLVNVWGLKGRSSVFEWDEAQDDPKDPRARKLSRKFMFKYPKDVYDLYRSAQVHTKKPRVPKWFKFGIPAIGLLIGGAGFYTYYAISHFASNSSKPMKQFLAAHHSLASSVASGPFALTSAAAHAVSPGHHPATPYFHRPLSHFDAYSLHVRNKQATKLSDISNKYRVVGDIVVGGVRNWIITSKGGNVHTVPAIRCSNFEGLEVCRWGGGYVAQRPVDVQPSSGSFRSPALHSSSASSQFSGGLSYQHSVSSVLPSVSPVHHHSILLPAHRLPIGG